MKKRLTLGALALLLTVGALVGDSKPAYAACVLCSPNLCSLSCRLMGSFNGACTCTGGCVCSL